MTMAPSDAARMKTPTTAVRMPIKVSIASFSFSGDGRRAPVHRVSAARRGVRRGRSSRTRVWRILGQPASGGCGSGTGRTATCILDGRPPPGERRRNGRARESDVSNLRANELLGYPADARLLIVNADDLGAYHAV